MYLDIENKIIDCLYNTIFNITDVICNRRYTFLNLYFQHFIEDSKLRRYNPNRVHKMDFVGSSYSVRFYFTGKSPRNDIMITWYKKNEIKT